MKIPSRRQGITLVKLLVAITIIAVLASLVFLVSKRSINRAHHTVCVTDLGYIGQAIQTKALKHGGCFPGSLNNRQSAVVGLQRIFATFCNSFITMHQNPKHPGFRVASVLVLVLSTLMQAQITYHVSPAGNDATGTGLLQAPWKTIATALTYNVWISTYLTTWTKDSGASQTATDHPRHPQRVGGGHSHRFPKFGGPPFRAHFRQMSTYFIQIAASV